MATVTHEFGPYDALPAATVYATLDVISGTNNPVPCIDFDAALDEAVFFNFIATAYGSGNLTVTIFWYADTASSGDVVWEAAIAAITANTDTQDIETDTFATANTVTDSHLGTTGQRLHSAAITVSNLDSLAAGDYVTLRIRRLGNTDAADTMTGDASLVRMTVAYSDT